MTDALVIRSERVVTPIGERPAAIVVRGETITAILPIDTPVDGKQIETQDVVLPALVDSHVHINEPGRTDWEGFDTATHAAAAGGIATLVDMPLNCIPVTTTAQAFKTKLDSIGQKLWVDCGYWGGATADNLADLPDLLQAGVLGAKSFTIHSGIDEFQAVNETQLTNAMRHLALAGLPHLVHAELDVGGISGQTIGRSYSNFLASRPRSWENEAIRMVIRAMEHIRDEGLVPRAHIVHLSSSEALADIQQARQSGLLLTTETCPHYLTLNAEAIPDGGTLYKCCPPIREQDNQAQLWEGLKNGDIDMIVSDHSPCTPQLKALQTGDIGDAWGGISALQFGLSLIWSEGQKYGFTFADIAYLMAQSPADIAGLGQKKGRIDVGYDADFCFFNPERQYTISADIIKHKHKVSPYVGKTVSGKITSTWLRGQPIFANNEYVGIARGQSLLR